MSLKKLETLNDEVVNIIIYVQSPSLAYLIKNRIRETYKAHRDFIVDIETQKQLNNAKLDSYVAPMLCDKWLLHVNADKLSKKELVAGVSHNTQHAVTVYWTDKWMTYNWLTGLDQIKQQGVHSPSFRFTRLSGYEISGLLKSEVPEKHRLNQELTDYVSKNYRYDVQSVMDLIALLRSGNTVENKRELIEAVGVGGNSISTLTIKILRANIKTETGRNKQLRETLQLLEDLSYTYNYQTIKRFMINNINGFIDMKNLQVMGIYGRPNKEIPEHFDQKRLSMLRRFERTILEEVSLQRLLNLKMVLMGYNDFNSEVSLIQAIMQFYGSFEVEPPKPRKPRKKKSEEPVKVYKKPSEPSKPVLTDAEKNIETLRRIKEAYITR